MRTLICTTLVAVSSLRAHAQAAAPRDSAAQKLNAIVVTASRRAQQLKDVVTTTELVTRQAIESTGAADIAAVLNELTGVQFTSGHPAGSAVSLEGLADQRVLILVDGLPLYGRISGGVDLTRIPASAVERVEIVKGPQSTLYGSEAMGGVINIITRTASRVSSLSLTQTAGSGKRSDTDLFGAIRQGEVSATTSLTHQYVERTPGLNALDGALTDRLSGLATIRWNAAASIALEASTLVMNDRQRWPSGALSQFADNTQLNARLGATWVGASSTLSGKLYYSRLDHLSRSSQFAEPIAGTGDWQRQRLGHAELVYSKQFANTVLDAGAIAKHEYIHSTDGRISGGSRTLKSAEPFAQLELSRGRWSIVPGARVSVSDEWGTYVTPRLAVRYAADPALTLRASVGRGYRAPDFKELYLDFSNNSASYAVRGNTSLRPESSDNLSVGAEWDGSRMYARAMVFANRLHDFIETVPLSSSGGIAEYSYANVTRAATRGVEVSSGTTLGAVRTEAGYAFLSTSNESRGGPLLGQPAHSARIMTSTPAPFGVQLTATAVHTGRAPMQSTASGSVTSHRDAFTRLDVRVSRQLLDRYTVSAGADNVFDARPAQWADATQRHLYVSATWQLRSR